MSRTFAAASSDKVTLASDPAATIMSVGIWTYRVGTTGIMIATKYNPTGNVADWLLYHQNSDAKIYFAAIWSTDVPFWSVPRPAADGWHHIGVSYNGGSTANDPVIYVDGVSQTVSEVVAPAGTRSTATVPLYIGSRSAGDEEWNGDLAEHAVWNRMVDAHEWAAMAKGYSPLFFPFGLVEYVPMHRDVISYKNAQPTVSGTAVGTVAPYPLILPTRVLAPPVGAVDLTQDFTASITPTGALTLSTLITLDASAPTVSFTGSLSTVHRSGTSPTSHTQIIYIS